MKLNISVLSILIVVCTSGCTSMYDWLRADPPETTYVDGHMKMVKQSADFPFRMMWIDKDTDLHKYKSIIIAPVATGHLSGPGTWDKFDARSVSGTVDIDSAEIARYMELSFRNAVFFDPKHRLKLVEKPGPETLKLELALIQLIPSKAELNVVENVVGIVIWPVAFLTVFNAGTTAFEGVLRDSETGRIVCVISDREKDEAAIFNIPSFTYYGNAKYFTDRWSKQFVDFMNAKDYSKLKTDFPLKLIVW